MCAAKDSSAGRQLCLFPWLRLDYTTQSLHVFEKKDKHIFGYKIKLTLFLKGFEEDAATAAFSNIFCMVFGSCCRFVALHAMGIQKNGKSHQRRANYRRKPTIYPEPECFKFEGSQASIPWNLFLVRNQVRCGIDSWTCEGVHAICKHYGSCRHGMNLWDMVDSIPYLVPTQFQESTPLPV
jgi:hypothetical protein